MSYWLEILCDVRTSGQNRSYEAHCYSDRNANPGTLSGNTTAERQAATRHLNAEAREQGWRKTGRGWTCPGCQKADSAESAGRKRNKPPPANEQPD